jgi:hypothetical protein
VDRPQTIVLRPRVVQVAFPRYGRARCSHP